MGWIGPTRELKRWLVEVQAAMTVLGEYRTRGQPIVLSTRAEEAVVHGTTQVKVGDAWVYVAAELIRRGVGQAVAVYA